jgi:polar amino acid transport system substrate-binding protein
MRKTSTVLAWIALWTGLSLTPQIVNAAPLPDILKRGHLIVAVKDNIEPLGYRDSTGELKGFEIELAKRLAQNLLGSEKALVLQPVNNTERLTAVTSGCVDMAIAHITVTENRMRLVTFSEAYYRNGTGLLVKDSKWKSLQALYRQAIAVLQPSVTLAYLRDAVPKARLVGVSSYPAAQTLLDRAQVQAIAGDRVVLSNVAQHNSQYLFYPIPLTVQPLAIALPKGVNYESLRYSVNQTLQQWQREGGLETQRRRWGLP